jgi:hypothetical protein
MAGSGGLSPTFRTLGENKPLDDVDEDIILVVFNPGCAPTMSTFSFGIAGLVHDDK